jgi:DNA-binding transcriptional MerR regulator
MNDDNGLMVTLAELVAIVERLEGQTCSPRQVRYLESFGVLPPRGRTEGGVRFYDAADVALVCLIVQLRQQDVPMWVVKSILVHLGATLRDLLVRKVDRAAVVDGPRMLLVKRDSAPMSRWTFDLRAIEQKASAAVRALRARQPEVTWAGWHTMPAYQAERLMEVTA